MQTKSVRLARAGDLIQRDGETEVIRNVVVILQLANGETVEMQTSETIDVLPPEDLTEIAEQVISEEEPVGEGE